MTPMVGEKEKGEEEEVILGMKAKILDHHSALHSVDTDNPLKEPVAQCCSKATEISNYARNTHSLNRKFLRKIIKCSTRLPLVIIQSQT